MTIPENLQTTSGLLIFMHDVILLPEAVPYDNTAFLQQFQRNILLANSGDPDQMPNSLASNWVLHCLHMNHKKG